MRVGAMALVIVVGAPALRAGAAAVPRWAETRDDDVCVQQRHTGGGIPRLMGSLPSEVQCRTGSTVGGRTFGGGLCCVSAAACSPWEVERGMVTRQRLLDAFIEMSDTLASGFDPIDFAHTLAATAVEPFELQHDQGPCVDAYRSGLPVTNVEQVEVETRWPSGRAAAGSTQHSGPDRTGQGHALGPARHGNL